MTPIEFETSANPEFSVIWLHGLGADGADFVPVAEALNLPGLRHIFPHAPMQPVTLNGGYVMRAWYDIYALDLSSGEDREGILASCEAVSKLIDRETERGLAADHVFLAGFSQGGAIALFAGLNREARLAGIVALSTYLPLASEARGSRTPIFMAHGREDDIIPIQAGLASKNMLLNLGQELLWRDYDMGHAVCRQEIDDISAWISGVMSKGGKAAAP